MNNSKINFYKKTIALILGLFVILNIFSGCTLSKKMRADVGFVINPEEYYYATNSEAPHSFLYVNNATGEAQEYTWGYPDFSPDGIDYSHFKNLNSNFCIVIYKDDSWQGMHCNKLYKHITDELVYLNPESKKAELLFRSDACEIIVYGTLEYVIIYNAEHSVYRYVSLVDNSIIHEVESNINPFSGDYAFCIYETKQIFEVYKYKNISNEETLVDSVPLNPNQYLE